MSAVNSAGRPANGGINKTPMIIALVLSIVLVLAVLFGARVLLGPAGQQQIAMSGLPAPDAESAECAALLEDLPGEAFGHTRAEIMDPVPPGAAAWSTSDLERVTLRCGVDMPFQYTALANTVDVDGTTWLPVSDMTPGSSLETWYSVNRFPVVAITADDISTDSADNPVAPFSSAVDKLEKRDGQPFDAPLIGLSSAGTRCTSLFDALPRQLEVGGDDGTTYERIEEDRMQAAGYSDDAVAWDAPGLEPIVIRCGVEPSENYAAGAMLQQIDDIPWFEDTILASGTTSSTWYALGREIDIAVSLPQAASSSLITLSGFIEDAVPAE
ncbi:DUF3515 domain-containing protein [Corynebacterium glutamicum]|uniref:DUF3515 domain-containing protein n=1 Tax=Corynebacterium glutamicum TaxID=1718 RepID=A0AB36IBY1_CORGT|nr:DUF3515 domain-containing protein [Corynebacterium glutamicum]AGN19060.1 hypothetical protein C624_07415 [Corynebacterium glutamicum SCgG1]AGN22083.1 hypothetical protein C629_07415 [Corynebacterium glutamicum SCgG2]EGV39168.1 hypothetical protein CgS9114_14852 [Corynebacterium glutamicum S9114]EPP40796.1 hypothetical protein A583_06923 [Corynebacterium glutamicum Z188]NII87453.1 hypothetical protein [Corynebacterium glutamicum]